LWFPSIVGVGQNEDPFPNLGRPDIRRSNNVPFRNVPRFGQISEDNGKSMPNKSGNVLQEDEARSYRPNPTPDVGPNPSLVVLALSLAGHAERLARYSTHDEIHRSNPSGSVERGDIGPDRSGVQRPVVHALRQNFGCRDVPFHVSDDAQSRYHETDAEFESCNAGTDGKSSDGR
jgi:hypothetical protein